jgi:hypothetical protein
MQPTMKRNNRKVLLVLPTVLALLIALPGFAATIGSITTNASGTGSAVFGTTGLPAGLYRLTATGCVNVYPPANPTISAPSVVVVGSSFTATITGFCANVSVSIDMTFLSSVSGDASFRIAQTTIGTATTTILLIAPGTVPPVFPPVVPPIVANPQGGTTIINVNNSSSSSSSAAASAGGVVPVPLIGKPATLLARTGTDVLPLLLAGSGAILLGTVLLVAGRRRARQSLS